MSNPHKAAKIVLISMTGALLFWVLDALYQYYFFVYIFRVMLFEKPHSFLDALILDVPPHALFYRLAFTSACLVYGLLVAWYFSQRRRAEDRLRLALKARDDLEAILNRTSVSIWQWSLQPKKELQFVSPNISRYGFTSQEFFSGSVTLEQIIHPEDLTHIICNQEKILANQNCSEFTWQFRLLDRANQEHYIEEHWWILRTPEGLPLSIQSVFVDITQQKTVEAKLGQTEERYRILADNTQDCVWVLNLDLVFTYVNPAIEKMMGYSTEDWIGSRLQDHCVGENLTKALDLIKTEIIRPVHTEGFTSELYMRNIHGDEVPLEITAKVLYDALNEPVSLQFTSRNISERKEAEQEKRLITAQLRQAQRLDFIGTLASGVAHNIINPVNGIINYAQLTSDRLREDPLNIKQYQMEIIHEGLRISSMVRQLLAFARKEPSGQKIRTSLADIVTNTTALIQTLSQKEQIILHIDAPESLPPIECHSSEIQQVLINLFSNARYALNQRFQGKHPRKIFSITGTADHKDDREWLLITVEDFGGGIPEEVRSRIFEPFFSTKPRDYGTGLGLSTSYGIVIDHKGSIECVSDGQDYTRFLIRIPAATN